MHCINLSFILIILFKQWAKIDREWIIYSIRTMSEHCLRDRPRKMGLSKTSGPVLITISQRCTHRPSVKCVQEKACPFWSDNCPYTSGCPLKSFRIRGPTQTPPLGGRLRAPTALRLMTNLNQSIKEDQEAAPIFCQVTEWAALPNCTETAHAAQVLT